MSSLPIKGTICFSDSTRYKACYPLKVAHTPIDIQIGMMGALEMDYALGFMVRPGTHSFWMKGCLISLDIVFCKDGKVHKIFHNCPPCLSALDGECQRYVDTADFVVELPGMTCLYDNIQVGDKVFKNDFGRW